MLGDILRSDATLERFARDLTADARAGRLEPVRCRDDEIARVIDILLRHGKNNPALVGPAGVGKTAIAEGLAQRVASGDVPLVLRSARVLAVDHVGMMAGTMYRGQFEERIRALIAEASADPDVILFIDELHNLIGQGTALGTAMDAANMLKPALVRGEFRVIGATTDDEYERWVRGDPALERRFQKVAVRELSADQALEILRARRERLERHHNAAIAEDALLAAVRLTDLFVTDRARPDRAIDALDEACAHAQATATYSPETARLILERRKLVREVEQERAARTARVESRRSESASSMDEPEIGDDGELAAPLDKLARDGMAALERFGAELEAAFSGARVPTAPADATRTSTQAEPAPPPAPATRDTSVASRLAQLETELQRRFMEEGIVVRGHDVARVVSVATGRSVQWTES
ncbi:MAG TPA: AAA family ATPase [Gemmatimonadaceae bacterium]|nr:AAA family ATPase [Gemmatimonadaceae bacterium]